MKLIFIMVVTMVITLSGIMYFKNAVEHSYKANNQIETAIQLLNK